MLQEIQFNVYDILDFLRFGITLKSKKFRPYDDKCLYSMVSKINADTTG